MATTVYSIQLEDGERDFASFSTLVNNFAKANGLKLTGLVVETATPAVAAIAVKAVAENLPFAEGDAVLYNGNLAQGEGVVVACWSAAHPNTKYDRPAQAHPQVEVKLNRTGKTYHLNGNDIRDGKIVKIKK